jgi:hypothetical protein
MTELQPFEWMWKIVEAIERRWLDDYYQVSPHDRSCILTEFRERKEKANQDSLLYHQRSLLGPGM